MNPVTQSMRSIANEERDRGVWSQLRAKRARRRNLTQIHSRQISKTEIKVIRTHSYIQSGTEAMKGRIMSAMSKKEQRGHERMVITTQHPDPSQLPSSSEKLNTSL